MNELIDSRFLQIVIENIKKMKQSNDEEDGIFFLTTLKSKKKDKQQYHLGLEYEYEQENSFWLFFTTIDIDGHEEKTFVSDLIIEDDEVEKYAIEIVKFVRHLNANIDYWCNYCYKPFTFYNDKLKMVGNQDKLISNFCKTCADKQIINIHSVIHRGEKIEDMFCDICNIKCLEKNEKNDETYHFNRLFHVACCKNKILCENCLKEQNELTHKNKCFFCKQVFERGCCIFC